jgi:hypothetical protein
MGDMLVLIGCCCYAVSNLGQEALVKQFDRFEFLGMLGFFGALVSAVQMAALETGPLAKVEWSDSVVLLYLLGFNVCLFSLYYLTPILLQRSSALFLNLSFLTSDFWSLLAAVLLFAAQLHPLYFFAFAIIIAGLLLYNLAGIEWRASCANFTRGGARMDTKARIRHVMEQVCGQMAGGGGGGDEDEEEHDGVAGDEDAGDGGGGHYDEHRDDDEAAAVGDLNNSNRTSSARMPAVSSNGYSAQIDIGDDETVVRKNNTRGPRSDGGLTVPFANDQNGEAIEAL